MGGTVVKSWGSPNFVAMGNQHRYFIPLESKPEIIQGAIKLNGQPIMNATNTCILALFEDDAEKIRKWCKSMLFKEGIESEITRLSGSLVVMANTQTYQLICSNGSTISAKGCEFCTISVPCDCAVASEKVIVPALLEGCEPERKVTKKHLVDLNTLIHLFDTAPAGYVEGRESAPGTD